MSCDNDRLFPLGCLVVIKRGRHAGRACVVVGRLDEPARVLIADGQAISVKHPKRKNPRHLQRTSFVFEEVGGKLARGERLDDGWLVDLLRCHGDKDNVTTCT